MISPIQSKKGQELINLYKFMVKEGYERNKGLTRMDPEDVYSMFGIKKFRKQIKSLFMTTRSRVYWIMDLVVQTGAKAVLIKRPTNLLLNTLI